MGVSKMKLIREIILVMALSFVFLVSCCSDNLIQKGSIKKGNNNYEQYRESYCGRGRYITYDKRDITIGEIKGKPSIYFLNIEMEQSIIYTNSECYGIYEIALSGEWVYFTERFGASRNNKKHYISCVKTDGSEYKKIKECCACMLFVYEGNVYYKDEDDEKVKCYNITNNTEMEIADYVSEFCLDEGKLYLFNAHNREAAVIDIKTGEKITIDHIFRKPIVRKNKIYYVKDKSNDESFQKNDVYYICEKDMDGKENIIYKTTDYIFSFVVLEESILVSQGAVNDFSESLEQKVDDISNPQAKLLQVQLGSSKETVIREDLSYHTDIYSTLNKVYFSVEEWNGKRWVYHDISYTYDSNNNRSLLSYMKISYIIEWGEDGLCVGRRPAGDGAVG